MNMEFLSDRRSKQSVPRDELLTIAEAAQRSKVNEKVIRKAIQSGEMTIIMLGPKSPRIAPEELKRWWKTHEV
jgi:excisionase family DNA binding protein